MQLCLKSSDVHVVHPSRASSWSRSNVGHSHPRSRTITQTNTGCFLQVKAQHASFCEPSTSGRQSCEQPHANTSRVHKLASLLARKQRLVHLTSPRFSSPTVEGANSSSTSSGTSSSSNSSSTAQAKRLTAVIKRCTEWQQLKQILELSPCPCNHIHVCAALSLLPRLLSRPDLLDSECRHRYNDLCGYLLAKVALFRPCMRPRELSNVLGACAKLGLRPSPAGMDGLVDAMQVHFASCNGQDCGSAAWALATLRYHPSPSWLAAFAERCEACMEGMDPQALSNLLWAFARWEYTPSRQLLHRAADCAGVRLQQCSPQALANVLWALARQRYQPSSAWMQAYWGAVHEAVLAGSMSASELSLAFFSAGKLGCDLPKGADRQRLLLEYLERHVHELGFMGSAYALWGLSMLRLRPAALIPAWYSHTQRMMDSHVAALRSVPEGVSAPQRPATTSRSLNGMAMANAIYAVHRLEMSAGELLGGSAAGGSGSDEGRTSWLRSAVDATTSLMPGLDVRGLAVSGLCLAKMGAPVDAAWRAAYVQAVASKLGSMNSAELANVVCTLSRLRQVPSFDLMCSLMATVEDGLLRFKVHELATTLNGLANLSGALLKHEEELPEEEPRRWLGLSRGLWASLLLDTRQRWESLPSFSIGQRDVGVLRRATLLVRQDIAWLDQLGSRVVRVAAV